MLPLGRWCACRTTGSLDNPWVFEYSTISISPAASASLAFRSPGRAAAGMRSLTFGRERKAVTVLKQVRIPRVYTVVVEQIRDLIETGHLKPGDKLPTERNLAEQLGISRSSVREALSALEVLGVIQSRQGLGNYVANNVSSDLPEDQFEELIEAEGTLEILEARQLFEPSVAALAARRRTAADLLALQSCITEMERLLGAGRDTWEPDWG